MFKALLFDFDGTVLDNNHVYEAAFRSVLKEIGGKTLNEQLPLQGSVGIAPNWLILLEKYKITTSEIVEVLGEKTQEEYLKNLDKLSLRDGFLDFIKRVKEKEIILGLATSNEKRVVDISLRKFNIEQLFNVRVTAEDVKNLKPAPDLFLKSAEILGVFPIDCLVIEDAVAGIEAAHTAGMRVACLVYDEIDRKKKLQADFLFENFNDPELLEFVLK